MDHIELLNHFLRIIIIWNHTAVCKLFVLDRNTWEIEFIKLCWEHSFLTLSCHPFILSGLLHCILCPPKADVNLCWSTNTSMSMCRGLWKTIVAYVFILTSAAVLSHILFLLGWFLRWGNRWLYTCCFVECCFQDLLKTAFSIVFI